MSERTIPGGRRRSIATTLIAEHLDDEQRRTRTRWHYSNTDPFALRVAVSQRDKTTGIWYMSRGMVHVGIDEPVGQGNVRLWPLPPRYALGQVALALRSETHEHTLRIPQLWLEGFLARTNTIVPQGGEESYMLAAIERGLSEIHRTA